MKNISLRSAARCSVQALLAVTLCVAPVAAFAQDDPNAAPAMQSSPSAGGSMSATGGSMSSGSSMAMHHHDGMGMYKILDLTDDQKAQIKAIWQKFKADHPTPGSATQADRKAMKTQIEAVLTPEQLAKYKAERKEHHMMSHSQPNQMPTVAP